MLEIKPMCRFSLRKVAPAAKEFYESSQFLRKFDLDRFVNLWRNLIETDQGVIFGAFEDGDFIGAIAGTLYPEPYCGDLIAQEFFWFVRPGHRGFAGMRLYKAFEYWCRERGCAEIRMGHLADLMPEKVAHTYKRLGYTQIETNYAKRLEGVQSSSAQQPL